MDYLPVKDQKKTNEPNSVLQTNALNGLTLYKWSEKLMSQVVCYRLMD